MRKVGDTGELKLARAFQKQNKKAKQKQLRQVRAEQLWPFLQLTSCAVFSVFNILVTEHVVSERFYRSQNFLGNE